MAACLIDPFQLIKGMTIAISQQVPVNLLEEILRPLWQ
ncbi:unannotated protein [freshwater metagenome]|uniref:Unannotated protein n=1 Tax=freshwater metagenome TaxID=449393 RepID=A0A6J7PZR2_9ZZZZ